MMKTRTFDLCVRRDETSEALAARIREALLAAGFTENTEVPETVIAVGGDGTFLFAVHRYIDHLNEVRFIGIHTGTLGFFTEYRDEDIDAFLDDFLSDRMTVEEHPIISAEFGGKTVYAVNELRLENPVVSQRIRVTLDGTPFEDFKGTGMMVSTALGSTAYNRSLGGAILEKSLPLLEITEIAGLHHRHSRSLGAPFVVPDSTEILFEADSFEWAFVGADSEIYPLTTENLVRIRKCPDRKLRILCGRKISYFDRLASLT